MKPIINILLIFLLLFAAINVASAVQELPFKRVISVNEWGMLFSTKASIDQVIDDVSYMNGDALIMYVGSEYFEAVRNPSRASWDKRASWNMLEYAITKAHERNIQLHVMLPVNSMISARAESRLWRTKYNVVGINGAADDVRIEPAYREVQDYEVDLLGFIANHYPTLDGIHIEEPFYVSQSYSPPIIARVKAKYNGYDITGKSDWNKVECRGSSMKGIDQTICPTFSKIYDVERDVFNELFIKIRATVNAKKSNPNLLLSANAADGYRPLHGFDPRYMSDNNLLDWYVAQTNRLSLSSFKSSVERVNLEVDNMAVVPVSFITWTSIYPDANQAVIDEVSNTCEYGGNAEWFFAYAWRNKIVNGKTAFESLHKLPPSSLCGQKSSISTRVSAPTFSIPPGTYSGTQSISISTGTIGATIRYTKDGTTPTETSSLYSTPIVISSTTTLKARAWKTGYTPSAIASATYTINTPTIAKSLDNPDFDSGTTSWNFYTSGIGTFSVVPQGNDRNNAAVLSLKTKGENIQLYQEVSTLEPNTAYRLSFSAYSTGGHAVTVNLIKHDTPYNNYGLDFTADLGTDWKTFTTEFTTKGFTGTANDGRLMFRLTQFAQAGETYYFDDIRLEKSSSSAPTLTPTLTLSLPKNAPGKHWVMTFSDEFTGTTIDKNKWLGGYAKQMWCNNGNCPEQWTGISVKNGIASLRGTIDYSNLLNSWQYENRAIMNTGGLTLQEAKFSQRYGYFEANMKYPTNVNGEGDGSWFSFWSLPMLKTDNSGKDKSQLAEIDIQELVMSKPNLYVSMTNIHDNNRPNAKGYKITSAEDLSTGFHRYGLYWWDDGSDHGAVQPYFDGKPRGAPYVLQNPLFDNGIFLMLQVIPCPRNNVPFGYGSPCTSKSNDDNPLFVDFVRAYKEI